MSHSDGNIDLYVEMTLIFSNGTGTFSASHKVIAHRVLSEVILLEINTLKENYSDNLPLWAKL